MASLSALDQWAFRHSCREVSLIDHTCTKTRAGHIVVKCNLSPASVADAIRREARNIDKDLPVTDIAMMPASCSIRLVPVT